MLFHDYLYDLSCHIADQERLKPFGRDATIQALGSLLTNEVSCKKEIKANIPSQEIELTNTKTNSTEQKF